MKKTILIAAILFAAAVPASASAHVDISPTESPAGKATGFSFTVGHGCEGAATTGLTVEMPDSVDKYEIEQLLGWKTSTPPGRMVWKGGPLADGELLGFPFRATVFGKKGEQVPFKVIQSCEGGLETAWISVGEGGPGHGTPAPLLTLTSTKAKPKPEPVQEEASAAAGDEPTVSAAPASTEDDGGDDGAGIGTFAIVALVAAAMTTLVVILRARRSGT